ncbi:MAG: phosphoglycerate kinase [Gemmataceae bacterium]|nr:phosphoglycerate kinase [Gemmataceae bacterium]MDW8265462.1 phosphoglycerate kinase [Gemmataceae bacterium]
MAKKTLKDLPPLQGKRVLVRVDFNVAHDPKTGAIVNDRRIRAAVPTLKYLTDAGARVIVMSHFGRPEGDPAKDAIYRLDRIAARLQELLGVRVRKVDEVVGPGVTAAVETLLPGGVLVLENLRFHPGEKKNDAYFAQCLADLGDIYVNEAFGTCHNAKDASMIALPQAMAAAGKPRVIGFLVEKELAILDQLLSAPPRPLVGVLGGAKVSDKIKFIESLLAKVDRLLIGGAMTYTFLKAQGGGVGNSRFEHDQLDVAGRLLESGKIVLPTDHVVADRPEASAATQVVEGPIPDGWLGVDIGPKTIEQYRRAIAEAGTVVWNGPMGWFELEPFSHGTRAVAEALAASKAVTIVGGGETAEAVEAFGVADRIKHVSTGGGAFLNYVESGRLPALDQIEDRKTP